MSASSAPGESPPLPRSAHETVSGIRHDIVKAGVVISEVHRDVSNTQTVVRNMLKSQEGAGECHLHSVRPRINTNRYSDSKRVSDI